MGEMEKEMRSGLEDARTGIKGEVQDLAEEHAKVLRQLQRRLGETEDLTGRSGRVVGDRGSDQEATVRPAWREYRNDVTHEPEPGEEQEYGNTLPLIIDWWREGPESRGPKIGWRAAAGGGSGAEREGRARPGGLTSSHGERFQVGHRGPGAMAGLSVLWQARLVRRQHDARQGPSGSCRGARGELPGPWRGASSGEGSPSGCGRRWRSSGAMQP